MGRDTTGFFFSLSPFTYGRLRNFVSILLITNLICSTLTSPKLDIYIYIYSYISLFKANTICMEEISFSITVQQTYIISSISSNNNNSTGNNSGSSSAIDDPLEQRQSTVVTVKPVGPR